MASIVKAIFHGRIERCDDSLPSVIFEDCLADILTEKPQVKSSTSHLTSRVLRIPPRLHSNLSVRDLLYKMEMNYTQRKIDEKYCIVTHWSLRKAEYETY